ncbi:MAG: hypothetical protein NDI88_07585 [Lysobacter sp.]|nr:hypothetical protein [Lysobacter sp.]
MSFRNLLAALLAAASLDAAAGEYTDLWWNPQESGWGANIVQQGETAFVTLFVYGPDGQPTWYVAPAARTFAFDGAGRPAFRGTLYRTQGPWQGGAFDPSKVSNAPVGQMIVEPVADGAIVLAYDAEGLAVTKRLVRQTFELPAFGANYHASIRLRQAVPGQAPWGTRQYEADVLLHIDEGQVFLRVDEPQGRCNYRGPLVQEGKFGRIAGQYECEGGGTGTFQLTDFEVTRHGFSGYLRTFSPANNQYGRFAAARY